LIHTLNYRKAPEIISYNAIGTAIADGDLWT